MPAVAVEDGQVGARGAGAASLVGRLCSREVNLDADAGAMLGDPFERK